MQNISTLTKNRSTNRISVIGGGNGGIAEAAYLALQGYDITLYDRKFKNISDVEGRVILSGSLKRHVCIPRITDDLKFAVRGAQIIFIILPAYAHKEVLVKIREYLIDGQIIVLMPGKLGGGLEALHTLREMSRNVTIFETESVIVVARRLKEDEVYIHGLKRSIKVGGVNVVQDKTRIIKDFALLKLIHSEFKLVNNIMEASFSEVGCVLHPVINLLSAARIEAGHSFLFYLEGVTPSVAKVLDALDLERLSIACAYGINVESVSKTTKRYYKSSGKDILSVLRSTSTYKDITCFMAVRGRFFEEDVFISLCLYKRLADLAGISVPVIDSIIFLAECMCGSSRDNVALTLSPNK